MARILSDVAKLPYGQFIDIAGVRSFDDSQDGMRYLEVEKKTPALIKNCMPLAKPLYSP